MSWHCKFLATDFVTRFLRLSLHHEHATQTVPNRKLHTSMSLLRFSTSTASTLANISRRQRRDQPFPLIHKIPVPPCPFTTLAKFSTPPRSASIQQKPSKHVTDLVCAERFSCVMFITSHPTTRHTWLDVTVYKTTSGPGRHGNHLLAIPPHCIPPSRRNNPKETAQ